MWRQPISTGKPAASALQDNFQLLQGFAPTKKSGKIESSVLPINLNDDRDENHH